MGFFYFIIGVVVGLSLLVLPPLILATMGIALAIMMTIALPLIFAGLIFFGILAALPAIGYAVAIAALLLILWMNDRKRHPPPARG